MLPATSSRLTPNLLGHRGARAEVLENTKAGFIYTHELQAKGLAGIEFDVQLTTDHQLLVTHDDTLDRLCAQQGRVEQLSAHYCQQVFQQATGHCLLTLVGIIPYLQGFRHIELEVKTHQRMNNQALLEALGQIYFTEGFQQLPIVLTSFDIDMLELLQRHQRFANISRGLLVENEFQLPELVNTALRLQVWQIGIYYQLITSEVVQYCHRYGLQVTAWTVNDNDIAQDLLAMGVGTVISDCPLNIKLD